MFHQSRPLFFTCETPLHAGSGDALGIVDMPIQRERHTSFPKIEASSIKGSLREVFEKKYNEKNETLLKAFGPDESASVYGGALGFTDARLLLFPVKSMKGVFAWITCPKVLQRLSEDLKLSIKLEMSGIRTVSENKANPINDQNNLAFNNNFILEEYSFSKGERAEIKVQEKDLGEWLSENLYVKDSYWFDKIKKDILVLSDNDFKDFVEYSTEVITRTKINNDTGTVQAGALFTEEYLPTESILYSLVLASPEFISSDEKDEEGQKKSRPSSADSIMDFFIKGINELPVIQLGGNATLGKGLLRTKIISN